MTEYLVNISNFHTKLKLAPTSPTSGGRSVGIVRWRTKARSLKKVENFHTKYFRHHVYVVYRNAWKIYVINISSVKSALIYKIYDFI
jgi:hypothetical protein